MRLQLACALLVIAACVIAITAVDNSDVDDSGRVARDGPPGPVPGRHHCDKHRCYRCRQGEGRHHHCERECKGCYVRIYV